MGSVGCFASDMGGESSSVVMVEAMAIGEGTQSSRPAGNSLSLPIWGSQGQRQAQQGGKVQADAPELSQHHPSRCSFALSIHKPIW